jgi:hypothetical protein
VNSILLTDSIKNDRSSCVFHSATSCSSVEFGGSTDLNFSIIYYAFIGFGSSQFCSMSSLFFGNSTFPIDSNPSESDGSRVGLIFGLVCGLLLLLAVLIWFFRRSKIESSTVDDERWDGWPLEMTDAVAHTFTNPIETVASTTFGGMSDIFADDADEGTLWQ